MLQFGYIFTTILATIGALCGWANPFIGLMVYYVFSVLRPTFLWFWVYPDGGPRYSFYVGVSTLAGWAFASFGSWAFLRTVWLPLLGLAIYLISGLFAWAISDINDTAAFAASSWDLLETQIKIGVMALVTLSLVRNEKQIKTLAWLITICLGYLAWVFNSQYFFDGYNRIYWHGFGGIDNNGAAMIMVAGVPLAFFMGLNDSRLWVKGLCFFAVLLLAHVVLFSFSRGGQLGLCLVGAATFVVTFIGLPRKGLTLLLTLAVVGITLRLAGPQVREEFVSIFVQAEERDASAQSRFDTWKAAWACIQDNPFGVGPRNFIRVGRSYGVNAGRSVHNLFLQTAADYGVAGAMGLCLFYFGSIWQAFWMTRTRTAKRLGWPRYFGHMVCISLGGFLACSMFIGMESVEIAYVVSLLGLCVVAYVSRMAMAEPAVELETLPELEGVAPRGEMATA